MSTRPRTGHLLFCIRRWKRNPRGFAGEETGTMLPDDQVPCPRGDIKSDDIKDIYQLIFGPMSSNRNLILMLVVIPPHHSQMAGILIHF